MASSFLEGLVKADKRSPPYRAGPGQAAWAQEHAWEKQAHPWLRHRTRASTYSTDHTLPGSHKCDSIQLEVKRSFGGRRREPDLVYDCSKVLRLSLSG